MEKDEEGSQQETTADAPTIRGKIHGAALVAVIFSALSASMGGCPDGRDPAKVMERSGGMESKKEEIKQIQDQSRAKMKLMEPKGTEEGARSIAGLILEI